MATLALAGGEERHSVAWRLDGPRRERSRVVKVIWRASGTACEWRFVSANAKETRRSVTIRVVAAHRERDPGEVCTAVEPRGEAKVRLQRALGDRRLRHAATG